MEPKRISKSKVYCCVPQCKSYYGGDISFHTFPSFNENLRTEWIKTLQINKPVSKFMRVCSRHFKNEDFFFNKNFVNKKYRLKRNVVPSLNLPVAQTKKRGNAPRKRKKENTEIITIITEPDNGDINTPENCGKINDLAQTLVHSPITNESTKKFKNKAVQVADNRQFEDKGVQVNTYENPKSCHCAQD